MILSIHVTTALFLTWLAAWETVSPVHVEESMFGRLLQSMSAKPTLKFKSLRGSAFLATLPSYKGSPVNTRRRKSSFEAFRWLNKCGTLCGTYADHWPHPPPQQREGQVFGCLQMTFREKKYRQPVKDNAKDIDGARPYFLRTTAFGANSKPTLCL